MKPMSAFVRALRPRQWLKNSLIAAAPLAAGVLFTPDVFGKVVVAIIAFCLTSSGGYLLNDLLDVESDRLHPTKRFRPIASGELSGTVAWPLAGVFLVLPATIVYFCGFHWLAMTLAAYVVIQISYCLWLKHQPVLDIFIVASGFVLRAIAGAAVADLRLTQWFILVISSGSLFMVAGKRYSEKLESESTEELHTRKTLGLYTFGYLRFVWTIAATLTLISYGLWAFDLNGAYSLWSIASVLPFSLAVFLYAFQIEAGKAAVPEKIVLTDYRLLICGAFWVLFALASVLTRGTG